MTDEEQRSSATAAILWSDRAREDLTAIGDYIATDNPVAARRWIDQLISDVERAAELPLAGRIVPEYERADIREVIRKSYRIVYLVQEDGIEVLTIFEGHRLIPEGVVPDDHDAGTSS